MASLNEHDLVIDGAIRKRKKKASQKFREEFGRTPLSLEEKIAWKCRQLVIGTGSYGSLPVMKDVEPEARHRQVRLLILPTADAIKALEQDTEKTNAILPRYLLGERCAAPRGRYRAGPDSLQALMKTLTQERVEFDVSDGLIVGITDIVSM